MSPLSPRAGALAVAVAAAAAFSGVVPSPTAGAEATAHAPHWAPAATATVHPGVRVSMAGVDCVAGFVLTDGTHAFLAIPAACSGAGQVDDSKCDASQDPAGLPVTVQGAKHKATLVYSSFTAMQLRSERNADRCSYNSLTLVRLDRRDIRRTNPSIPLLGGPTGVSKAQPSAPDQLMVYSGSASPAQALSTSSGGWATTMMVDGAVTSADVGAAVVTGDGRALGMVTVTPDGGSGPFTATNLRLELRYLHTWQRFSDVHLAKGTVKFGPGGLRLG